MEDILSSIKRIIAEEGDAATGTGRVSVAHSRPEGGRVKARMLAASFLVLALCALGGADKPAPIVIGHYASLTGSEATFGQDLSAGIRLAIKDRNARGGVKGRQIVLREYDTRGQAQDAGAAVLRLINSDHVVAIIGEASSTLSIAGGRICQQYGVPMITPSATNPKVTQVGDMISRVCFLDDFQGWAMAKFVRDDLKLTRVGVLYDQGQSYSTGLKEYFAKAFKEMGGVITSEQAYTGGDQDYSAQLTTIRATNPEAVYIPGYYTDAGNIALQARRLGISVPLLGGDVWDSPKLSEVGGAAIEGVCYSNHYTYQDPRPEVQEFVRAFRAEKGEIPPTGAALSYDAARLLFDAMDRAASLDGATMARAIARTKDFAGVTGVITFDANRDARKEAVICEMRGGMPVRRAVIAPPASPPE